MGYVEMVKLMLFPVLAGITVGFIAATIIGIVMWVIFTIADKFDN